MFRKSNFYGNRCKQQKVYSCDKMLVIDCNTELVTNVKCLFVRGYFCELSRLCTK